MQESSEQSSATRQTPQTIEAGVWPVLRWAGLLAGSWTWVIGLLWPALLVRDFGLWGWLAFALPNVVGAAGFGFVLGRPEISRAVAERHENAAVRFSEVTIAFHVFAAGWVLWALAGYQAAAAAAVVAMVTWLVGFNRDRWLARVGLVAVLISLGLLAVWGFGAGDAAATSWTTAVQGTGARFSPAALALLSPGLAIGFLLCPYLDLTFHRARQATTSGTGKAAFALGFGVFFPAMIVFSLLYAVPGAWLFAEGQLPGDVPDWARLVLAGQIALQAGLTTGLHLHEVAARRGHAGLHRVLALSVAGGALAYWGLQWFATPGAKPVLFGLDPAELVYRCFILFYGLIFPGYVWLVMIPTFRGGRGRTIAMRAKVMLWLAATLLALPGAFYGFVGERFWLIGPALGVLVLARLVLAMWPGKTDSEPDQPESPRTHV